MTSIEKLADILRIKPEFLIQLDSRMSAVFNKTGVFDAIITENEKIINDKLLFLNVKPDAGSEKIMAALLEKIQSDEQYIANYLNNPDVSTKEGGNAIGDFARKITNPQTGYFLKFDKAREFLLNQPPLKTMAALGYQDPREMIAKEDLLELFSSIRFLEDGDWLNNVFFKQYEQIKFDDFEERQIEIKVLDPKWAKAAEKFVAKKYHNISHLKELGVVFIIPIKLGISGEILRILALLTHYLNEIAFYNKIFVQFSNQPETFAQNFIDTLKGTSIENKLSDLGKTNWLIIQQYLAKNNPDDWRLFEAHVNPEVIHWEKAEQAVANIPSITGDNSRNLDFWLNLGWVGGFFKDVNGWDQLISFNLVDTVMSLVKQKDMVKYLYHHQEALWNKIFTSYTGISQMENLIKENWLKGYIEI